LEKIKNFEIYFLFSVKTLDQVKKGLLKKVDNQQSIDSEIFDVVLGLNAFDMPTQTSCAGHGNKKWTYPFVDIYTDNQHIKYNDYSPESIKRKEKLIKKNIAIQARLIQLLKEFYKNRKSIFEYMITPHTVIDWGEIRLKSIGADTLQNMTETQRTTELTKYQNEMHQFGAFLLKKYTDISKKNKK
jgi:hypothetical protein